MTKKITIPQQNQPFRRQSSLGGNVSFRNLGGTDNNNYVVMAVVTKVYYKQGRVDFKLTNSTNHVVTETGDGMGSAPIPVDFYGYQRDGKIFGHYRPIQIGDLIAVAYLWGHKQAPIVLGVYPKDSSSYEFVAPQGASSFGDDRDEATYDYALGDQKIFPDGSLEYHSGNGKYFKTLRGKSFMLLDDSPLYEHLWVGYNDIGAFKDSDQNTINPLQEEAGDWLLVHEDNNEGSNSTDHRTRFYVNKDGTFQVVLSKSSKLDNLVILEGSKSNGFTLQQLYNVPQKGWIGENDPHKEPDIKNAQQYVKFNIGGSDRSATIEAATKDDSVEQATKLEIKDDGIYVNDKPLISSNPKYAGKTIIDDTISNSDGLNGAIKKAQDAAEQAAEQAKQAGEIAKAAGAAAEAAGKNALDTGDRIKKNVIYYANKYKGLHPGLHLDGDVVAITGKSYIEDSVINSAMIENGAIDHAKIANEAVWSSQIANLAVTRAKIADAAIGSAQIEKLAVTDEKVGKLTFDHMVGATLDAGKINVINLNAESITAGTITADKLKIGKLSEITGDAGQLIKGHIQASDDPNSGVQIDGLDADDPNKYTPAKKAFLLSEVKKLDSAAEAAIDYGKSTGVDYSGVENARKALHKGLDGLLNINNLAETTEFDYNTVIKLEQDLQYAISAFHNSSNSDILAKIGTTADGKNTIYRGTEEPQNPHTNDIWLQILNDGTYNIRVWDGGQWINPGLADIKAVENSLSNLPKSYYQAEEPVGDSVHDGDTWYKLTMGSDGKYTYVAYKREGNSWTPLLNAGEVSNQSSINTLQSDLEQARELIKDDGGGINLYTGTENFSDIAGRSWFHRSDANWALTDRRDPNGNLEMQKNGGAWNGLGQALSVEPGKYTFSCYLWVHLTGNETLNFYAGDNQYEGTATVGTTDGTTQFTANDSDKYIHVTITYNVTNGGVLAIRPELNQDSGTFWVSSYKLEKGSQATPWCRNGNDYMAVIQQARANAASDAAKIRTDVAKIESEVASAKSASQDSINTLQNDIDVAKKDLADTQSGLLKAQSVVEQNQKLITDSVADINSKIDQDRADIGAIQGQLTSAQSSIADTRKALDSNVAQVQNEIDTANSANSASVDKLKSDIGLAQKDLGSVHDSLTKAQSAVEQNKKLITDSVAEINANVDATNQDLAGVRKDLTKAQSGIIANQKAVNDNVAQINSDIEQDRKDIASAQQANADTAKQLDDYSKQATEQGKTIKTIQDKQDSFTATLADVQGNVSQVSDKVSGLSANLKGAQDNVASVKAQADQLSATLTDHAKSIATLTASAKELSSTLEDADGRLNKVEQTAQTNSSTLSDMQGNLSQVKQQADGLVSTLKDAQGNISTLQQKTDSVSAQLATAQGDIATLQTGVDSVKATLTSHDKSIHTLQADSKSLKDSMVNAQGDISTLRKTATDVTSELEDHTGRLSKVEQSAAKQATTLSDLQGNLSQVEQKADSNTATISSINENAMQDRGVITDTKTSFDSLTQLGTYSIKASGLPMMPEQHYGTLVVSGSAGSGWLSQQFVADATENVYTRVFSNNAWSAWKQGGSQDAINQVKQTADSNSATIRNVQGDVNTLKQTATGVEAALADHDKNIHTLQADSKTLKDDMADAKGNISSLQKTSTSLVSEFKDHDGRISKAEQTASTLANEFSDQQGHLSRVEQTAQGTQQTVANQQGQINTIKTDVSGIHETLTGQGNQIANINVTLNGLNTKYEGVSGDLGKLKNSAMQDRGTVNAPDFNSLTQAGYYTVTNPINGKNYPIGNWGTLEVSGRTSDSNGRLNQKYVSDNNAETYVRQYNANTKSWTAWTKTANQNDVTALSNRITTNSTQITQNKQAIVLKADQSTVNNLSGEVSEKTAQLKVQADSLSATVTDQGKNISSLQATAKELSSTLKDADGRLSKVEQTAKEHSSTLSDLQGNLSQVKQTATGLVTTLKDAQGNIDQIKQDAKGTSEQLSNAQGDITALQKDVGGIKLTIADHEKNIHTLQADSKTLKDDMADAKGNISSLQKTSTSLVSEFKDHDGRLSKVEQTATEHTSELADTKGNLDKVTQKADSLEATLTDAQKDINSIKVDASGIHEALTGQSNQLANLNVTLNNLDSKYSGITGDLQSKQTALSTEQKQTKDMLLNKADKSEVDNVKGTVNQVSAEQKTMAGQISQKVSSAEYQTLKNKVDGINVGGRNLAANTNQEYTMGFGIPNTTWKDGFAYAPLPTTGGGGEILPQDPHTFWYGLMPGQEYTQTIWFQTDADIIDVNAAQITWFTYVGHDFQPAKIQKLGNNNYKIFSTYKWPGKSDNSVRLFDIANLNRAVNLKSGSYLKFGKLKLEVGNVSTDYSPNPDDTITSIQKNTTAIDENSKAIKLKADQTEVDNVKNTASYNSSRLDVMNNEIKSKVSSTDVNNIVDSKGYATQNTVQSLIDQKAGTFNESITNLEGKFNSSSSVNLAEKTNQGTTNWTVDPGNGASTISEVNINGIRGVRFTQTRKSTSWWVIAYNLNLDYFEPNQDYIISFDIRTSSDNFAQDGMLNIARGDSSHAYLANTSFRTNFKGNQLTHVSCTGHSYSSLDKNGETFYLNCLGLGQCDWVDIVNLKIARGTIDKGYSPAPSDNATVTQLQSVTASIDGLKSIVVNKDGIASMINQKADSIEAGITGKLSSLNYGGLVLDKNGATLTSGNTHVYLNGTNGFQIQNGTSDVFHVDTNGKLNMKGAIMSEGDISGVNFTGSNLTLAGDLRVINKEDKVGHILLGNTAVLDSQGLSLRGGGLFISDASGKNLTTHIDSKGTFITNKGVFNGSVTATSLTIPEGSSADINVGGKFMVNSNGDVTANSFTATDVKITGGTYIQGDFNSPAIHTGNIYSSDIYTATLHGGQIIGNEIVSSKLYSTKRESAIGAYYPISNSVYTPSFFVNDDGTVSVHTTFPRSLSLATGISKPNDPKDNVGPIFKINEAFDRNTLTGSIGYGKGYDYPVPYLYGQQGGMPSYPIDSKDLSIVWLNDVTKDILLKQSYCNNYRYTQIASVSGITSDYKSKVGRIKINFGIVDSYGSYDVDDDTTAGGIHDLILVLTTGPIFESDLYHVDPKMTYFNNMNNDIRIKMVSKKILTGATGHAYYNLYGELSTQDLGPADTYYLGVLQQGFVKSEKCDSNRTWKIQIDNLDAVPDSTIDGDQSYYMPRVGGSYRELAISPNGSITTQRSRGLLTTTSAYNAEYITFSSSVAHHQPYWTTVSSDGIGFSIGDNNSSTDGSGNPNGLATRQCIYFSGDTNQNGMSMDNFGNIHAQAGAGIWRIYNNQGDEVFNVPFDPNGVFNFYVPRVNKNTDPNHKWGGLKIGWVYFDQPRYRWAETVPAIYNTGGRVKGIAMFDQYLISFVDGWCYQLSSWWNHGVPNGVDISKGEAEGTNTDAGHRGV